MKQPTAIHRFEIRGELEILHKLRNKRARKLSNMWVWWDISGSSADPTRTSGRIAWTKLSDNSKDIKPILSMSELRHCTLETTSKGHKATKSPNNSKNKKLLISVKFHQTNAYL